MIVSVRGLVKIYEDGTIALNGVDLSVERSEVCIVAGPNGAGKTTLLRIISGELKPTKGEVSVLSLNPARDRARLLRRVGVLPQEYELYEDLTVWEHLYYLAILKGLSLQEARREARRVIELLELEEVTGRLVRSLSGGLKRRVALAQALIGDNELLLLDEPMAGLDPESRRRVARILEDLRGEGVTVIVTTHYLDEIGKFADSVVVLKRGKVVRRAPVDVILGELGYNIKLEVPATRSILGRIPEGVKYAVAEGKLVFWLNEADLVRVLSALDVEAIRSARIERPTLDDAYLELISRGG